MDFLLQYYEVFVMALAAIFGVLKWVKATKYANTFKEFVDIGKSYKAGKADGRFSDAEKIALADEVIEAVEQAEQAFSKKK